MMPMISMRCSTITLLSPKKVCRSAGRFMNDTW
jgi:hypothetical protein